MPCLALVGKANNQDSLIIILSLGKLLRTRHIRSLDSILDWCFQLNIYHGLSQSYNFCQIIWYKWVTTLGKSIFPIPCMPTFKSSFITRMSYQILLATNSMGMDLSSFNTETIFVANTWPKFYFFTDNGLFLKFNITN
jgi:hypothetical protein